MAVSAILSTAVAIYFRSVLCGAVSFLSGVFIDIDHVFDYLINHGIRINIAKLYEYCANINYRRLSLIFHSYELVALLWVSIVVFQLGDIWKALTIGIAQHLILDTVRNISLNKLNWRAYFFTYRFFHRFRTEKLVSKR